MLQAQVTCGTFHVPRLGAFAHGGSSCLQYPFQMPEQLPPPAKNPSPPPATVARYFPAAPQATSLEV